MKASKEDCDNMLLVLHRNSNRLRDGDYDQLHNFLKAVRKRLPYRATYDRAAERRLERFPLKKTTSDA